MSLLLTHARYQFTETVRIPIAVIGNTAFPTLILLFFVVPFVDGPAAATTATAQIAVFAVMNVCLFTYGVGVAEDRSQPWEPYVRTLPAGPWPRLGGRLVNGLAFAVLALVPLLLTAALVTEATAPPLALLAGVGTLLVAALPFLFGGFAIGYSLPVKAALPVANIAFLPLGFGGGLFIPPQAFAPWLNTLSTFLPSRGGRDLVVWAVNGVTPSTTALVMLAVWTVAAALVAGWAYQRDEGRRFR